MWTETQEGRKFIEDVSRRVVEQMAPEETDLFDELTQQYFQNPTPPDLSHREKDDALGFGLGEAVVAVTPAVLAAASGVLGYVLTEALKTAQEETAAALKQGIKRLFDPKNEPSAPAMEGPPALTNEELRHVQQIAVKEAEAFGMKRDEAQRMADALIGCLVLA